MVSRWNRWTQQFYFWRICCDDFPCDTEIPSGLIQEKQRRGAKIAARQKLTCEMRTESSVEAFLHIRYCSQINFGNSLRQTMGPKIPHQRSC